jgi:hypothetical protein
MADILANRAITLTNDSFSYNLPRCQARLEDELSLITWRGINTFVLEACEAVGVSLFGFAPIYAYIKSRCSSSDFREIRAIL